MNPIPAADTKFPLPTARLLLVVIAASFIPGVIWTAVTYSGGGGQWDPSIGHCGLAASAVVATTGILGLLVMTPWKPRDVTWWMTLWLAGTTSRLLLTPALAWLLYSVTSLNPSGLTLAVGITYVVVLMAEAATLARFVHRTLYA